MKREIDVLVVAKGFYNILDLGWVDRDGAFVDERIISCGLLLDESSYCEDSLKENVEFILFNEWDGLGERAIVAKVYDCANESLMEHRFTVICGFNVLRFDVPLLICKAVLYGIAKHEVVSKMWNDCFAVDYFQQLLGANGNQFKGLTLEKVAEVSKSLGFKPPLYSKPGSAIKELYEAKKYKEIEKHLKQDLKIVHWLDLYEARKLIETSVKEGKALFHE